MRAVVLCLLLSSCVAFVEEVPERWTPKREPRCTATSGWVVWDALLAVGHGAAGVLEAKAISTADDAGIEIPETTKTLMLGNFAVAGLHVVSMIVAGQRIDECEDAREKRDAWLEQNQK